MNKEEIKKNAQESPFGEISRVLSAYEKDPSPYNKKAVFGGMHQALGLCAGMLEGNLEIARILLKDMAILKLEIEKLKGDK